MYGGKQQPQLQCQMTQQANYGSYVAGEILSMYTTDLEHKGTWKSLHSIAMTYFSPRDPHTLKPYRQHILNRLFCVCVAVLTSIEVASC